MFITTLVIYVTSSVLTLPLILFGWLSNFSLNWNYVWFLPSMVISLYLTIILRSTKKALFVVTGAVMLFYLAHLLFKFSLTSIYLYSDITFLSDPSGYLRFQYWVVSTLMEELPPYPWLSGGFAGYLLGLIIRNLGFSYKRGNIA